MRVVVVVLARVGLFLHFNTGLGLPEPVLLLTLYHPVLCSGFMVPLMLCALPCAGRLRHPGQSAGWPIQPPDSEARGQKSDTVACL